MADNQNVLGVRNFLINDRSYDFEPNSVSAEKGGDVLSTAANRPSKRTRARTPAAISGTIYLDCSDRLADICICDAVVSVEYFDGRVHTIRGADFIGNATFNGSDNGIPVRFEGTRLTELTYC